MNYAPRTFREFTALKDILYGSDDSPTTEPARESRESHITDKLLERLFAAALPSTDPGPMSKSVSDRIQGQKNKPPFSVPVMARNFSRLNARVGVVFAFQYKVIRILAWSDPTHTFSVLAVYSFLCLYPHLFILLPVAAIVLGIMVPAYVTRHPPAPSPLPAFPVPADGPPLAAPVELKPVPELSRDFLMNMRDIQNTMDDFARAYDKIVGAFTRPTNFNDEAYSSAVYVTLVAFSAIALVVSAFVPWKLIFLVSGWLVVSVGHPKTRRVMKSSHDIYMSPHEKKLASLFENLVKSDIVLDQPPETRTVEIFELQRQKNTELDEWDDWVFSCSPYEPLNTDRISHRRPLGVSFIDEVLPPVGWKFTAESGWKLDLRPHEWVANRSVVAVEVDSNSKWVYDKPDLHRGEWRRRRWVRLCERQQVTEFV
ncbi:Peroxin/Dysferlin domain-containing protein [Lipomyces arxii]|uniref:Peroxin/Dysferlin domain-containing protein n=1 Tax=Lipomyces arxii TaxID=56418 RepID=UPI0034CDEF3A